MLHVDVEELFFGIGIDDIGRERILTDGFSSEKFVKTVVDNWNKSEDPQNQYKCFKIMKQTKVTVVSELEEVK